MLIEDAKSGYSFDVRVKRLGEEEFEDGMLLEDELKLIELLAGGRYALTASEDDVRCYSSSCSHAGIAHLIGECHIHEEETE